MKTALIFIGAVIFLFLVLSFVVTKASDSNSPRNPYEL